MISNEFPITIEDLVIASESAIYDITVKYDEIMVEGTSGISITEDKFKLAAFGEIEINTPRFNVEKLSEEKVAVTIDFGESRDNPYTTLWYAVGNSGNYVPYIEGDTIALTQSSTEKTVHAKVINTLTGAAIHSSVIVKWSADRIDSIESAVIEELMTETTDSSETATNIELAESFKNSTETVKRGRFADVYMFSGNRTEEVDKAITNSGVFNFIQ